MDGCDRLPTSAESRSCRVRPSMLGTCSSRAVAAATSSGVRNDWSAASSLLASSSSPDVPPKGPRASGERPLEANASEAPASCPCYIIGKP